LTKPAHPLPPPSPAPIKHYRCILISNAVARPQKDFHAKKLSLIMYVLNMFLLTVENKPDNGLENNRINSGIVNFFTKIFWLRHFFAESSANWQQ
jgi:hypothetical protein